MTEQEHVEISRDLALAIGWKPEQIKDWGGYILVGGRLFDYRDELIAFRVAERLKVGTCWVKSSYHWIDGCWAADYMGRIEYASTPQLAIARAVIAAKGVK